MDRVLTAMLWSDQDVRGRRLDLGWLDVTSERIATWLFWVGGKSILSWFSVARVHKVKGDIPLKLSVSLLRGSV